MLRRGCYEDVSSQCNSDTKCAQCFGSGCNRGHPNHKCVKCESKNDINCFDKSHTLHPTQCLVYSDLPDEYLCYVKWVRKRHMNKFFQFFFYCWENSIKWSFQNETSGDNERGCVSKLCDYQDCLRNSETCKMCTPDAAGPCNTFQFPGYRRKCIQCYSGSRDCPNQYQTNTIDKYSVACKTIVDSCVVINRGSGQQWQTCASDMSESEMKYCTDNKNQCKFCNDNDNCNWNDKMDEGSVTAKPNLATSLNASCYFILLISPVIIKLFS